MHIYQATFSVFETDYRDITGGADIITVYELAGTDQVEMVFNTPGITDDGKSAAHEEIVSFCEKSIDMLYMYGLFGENFVYTIQTGIPDTGYDGKNI